MLAPSVTSVSALAASAIDDDVFRVGNRSVFWRATHNGTTTRWAQRQNATYRAVATSNASSNASAGDEVFYNGIYVTELVSVLNNPPYSTDDFWCDIDFAYCGRASCARHAASNTSVEIASCACQPIQASASMYAEIDWSDADLSFFLAQSATWVAIVEEYLAAVDGGASGAASNRTEVDAFANLTESMCDALREKKLFESMSADRISLPCPPWDEQHPEKLVKHKGCETPLSVAVCSGAPCYNNKKSDGPLNVTCLCPVYPYDEANHTFGLIPP